MVLLPFASSQLTPLSPGSPLMFILTLICVPLPLWLLPPLCDPLSSSMSHKHTSINKYTVACMHMRIQMSARMSSACGRKHAVFVLLSACLACFFHIRMSNFIFLYGCIKLPCICGIHFLYPVFCWWTSKLVHFLAIVNCTAVNHDYFWNAYLWKPFFSVVEVMKIVLYDSKLHFRYFQVKVWMVTNHETRNLYLTDLQQTEKKSSTS